jgi:hypothetical protein
MATEPDDVRFQRKTGSSRPATKMTRLTLSGPAADAELNVGTFVSVITLFCALQFPLRLVPELFFASFRFARLLPQFERALSYLFFCWLGHDEFSQSAEIQP